MTAGLNRPLGHGTPRRDYDAVETRLLSRGRVVEAKQRWMVRKGNAQLAPRRHMTRGQRIFVGWTIAVLVAAIAALALVRV